MNRQGRARKPRALVVAYSFPPIGGGGVARTLGLVPQALIECLEDFRRRALGGGPRADVRASLCAVPRLVSTLERVAKPGASG